MRKRLFSRTVITLLAAILILESSARLPRAAGNGITVLDTNILKGGKVYSFHVESNTTVLIFAETQGSLVFRLSGEIDTLGYVGMILPEGLNSSIIKVFLNSTRLAYPSIDPPRSISWNGTHYFVYFAFAFYSTYDVVVALSVIGDVNYDGTVDIFDAILVAAAYGYGPGSLKWNAHADFNDDNSVDIFDAIILAANYGKQWT